MACDPLNIYDPQHELENRLASTRDHAPLCRQPIYYIFIRLFRTGAERLQTYPDLNLRIAFLDPDRRRNRMSSTKANEVGAIMLDDGGVGNHS